MSSGVDPSVSVSVGDVTLSYTKTLPLVLDSVNTKLTKGSIYCLLGPSGCGKTSLLKVIDEDNNLYLSRSDQVILGLLSPDTGHVDVSPDLEVPGPGVGLMPQSLALHPYFSCREILWYYASLAGVLPVMIDTRIATILRFLKLSAKVGPTSLLETDVNWRNQGK